MQNPSSGSPLPVTSCPSSMTAQPIKKARFLMAAFPSPKASKCSRILAVSSAYNSCSVEVRLSSLISDQPNSRLPCLVLAFLCALCELSGESFSALLACHTREPKAPVPDFESGWPGPLCSKIFSHRRFFPSRRSGELRLPPHPPDCQESPIRS